MSERRVRVPGMSGLFTKAQADEIRRGMGLPVPKRRRFTIIVSTGHDFGRDFTTRAQAEKVRDRYAELYPGIGYTVEEVR